jgi:6-phosphogluconolactonase (cycloisomerase 2 family)
MRSSGTRNFAFWLLLIVNLFGLVACGGGGSGSTPAARNLSIGVTVSGLVGDQVVIGVNDAEFVTATANESFDFSIVFKEGDVYSVTVSTQPLVPSQTCTVTNGSGTITNQVSVAVSCTTNGFAIGGELIGLQGGSLVIQQNGAEDLTLTANENFAFPILLDIGETYNVSILRQPFISGNDNQNCTISNNSGTVASSDVSNIVINCIKRSIVGGSVSGLKSGNVVLQLNGGNNITLTANGEFNFSEVINDGVSYNVTVLTQPINPSQLCTVNNGSAVIAADVTNVLINCHNSSASFVYMANGSAEVNNVSTFSVDKNTGVLAEVGTRVTAGRTRTDLNDITVDPTGRFVYVANTFAQVSGFSIINTTGALSKVGDNDAGSSPASVVVEPGGRFAYVALASTSEPIIFSIDRTSGALTQTGTAVTATGTDEFIKLSMHPTGRFVYAANFSSGNLSVYSVDQSNGALTKVGTEIATGNGPSSIAINPTGRFAYVSNLGSENVSTFSIDQSTGSLVEVSSAGADGTGPSTSIVDPTGRFLYAIKLRTKQLITFRINETSGALTQIFETPSGDLSNNSDSNLGSVLPPTTLAMDPRGDFIYVSNYENITIFSVNHETGGLTVLSTDITPNVNDLLEPSKPIAISPAKPFAYTVSKVEDTVSTYSIDQNTGALTEVGAKVDVGEEPSSMAIDPTGRFAYVANSLDNTITALSINSMTGSLTKIAEDVATGGELSASIAVEPTGRYLYSSNTTSKNISVFNINSVTGALTLANSVVVAETIGKIRVSPHGQFVYVIESLNNSVTTFRIDQDSGGLSKVEKVTGGTGPIGMTIDPSGRFAYVANKLSNDVTMYSINANNGALSKIETEVAAGDGALSVTVDVTGRFAYVTNFIASTISVFSIDGTTGELTKVGVDVMSSSNPTSSAMDSTGRFLYVNTDDNRISVYNANQVTGQLTAIDLNVISSFAPKSITVLGGSN